MSVIENGFLKKTRVKNFKVFEDESIEFEPGITILTGRNGVGKSLLIDGIRLAFGLSPCSIRLNNLQEYLKEPDRPAIIELELSNPVLEGSRFLNNEFKDFSDKFLNSDIVFIRFQINPKGKIDQYGPKGDHQYFMRNMNEKWIVLSLDEVELLISTLKNAGIDPDDKLAFVPAEDFIPFVLSSPQERFQKFIEKIGLSGTKLRIEQIKKEIKEKVESINNLEFFFQIKIWNPRFYVF
jgi:chromosome segregation ATPase